MSFLIPIYFEDLVEKYEIIIFTNLLSISSRITFLCRKLNVLLDYDHDIYQYYVPIVKSFKIETKIIVLGKKIRKSDSRKIIRIKIINGIIKRKEIKYI